MTAPKWVFAAAAILLVAGLLPLPRTATMPFWLFQRFPLVGFGLLVILLASFVVWRLSERRWRQ